MHNLIQSSLIHVHTIIIILYMYCVYLNEFGCPLNEEFFTDSISSMESLTLQLKEEKERNEKLTARLTGKALYSVFLTCPCII